jgi:hypothetical protein
MLHSLRHEPGVKLGFNVVVYHVITSSVDVRIVGIKWTPTPIFFGHATGRKLHALTLLAGEPDYDYGDN